MGVIDMAVRGILLLLSLSVADRASAISKDWERRTCPHFQQISCLGDVLEKACEPGEPPAWLDPMAVESVWMGCCPLPYMRCPKAQRNSLCHDALTKHIAPLKPDNVNDEKMPVVRNALQAAWAELWSANADCQKHLAAPKPFTKCGSEVGEARTIARQDLFCDTVTWQWEELGDGNEAEFERNKCPVPTLPKGDGSGRKYHGLQKDDL